MKFLHLTWSNLKRRKLRTALTLLSILVAFLLFGFLCAIKEAFNAGVSLANADRLMVRHKTSIIQSLPVSYEARIAGLPGVSAVTHMSWFGGIYKDPKDFMASFPVEPEKYLDMYKEFILPPEQLKAWKENRIGAVVGRTTFDRFAARDGWKIGSRIPLTSPIWGSPPNADQWEFEIVGVYDGVKKGTETTQFLFRYDYFDEAREKAKGMVGWYGVRVQNPDQAPEIAKRINEEFANSAYEVQAETEAAMAQGFAQQMGDIGTILIAVLSAVFFTILLVAGNTMSQAVRERVSEIGTLKAIGFTNAGVLWLVMGESLFTSIVGGFIGLGLAWGLISAGNPVPNMLPIFYLPVRDVATGAFLAVVLGLVAGMLPAFSAMRLKIADALRRTG
jgi:putative ABC transport system permease protein